MKRFLTAILALVALTMAVSACDDPWCLGITPTYGPIPVVPGETVTLNAPTAPSGHTYTYYWGNYMTPVGGTKVKSDGPTVATNPLLIPTTASNGEDFGAVLTLTDVYGSSISLKCISMACIWLQVFIVNPSLTNFCHGLATDTDGFVITGLPATITYKWFMDGSNTETTITTGYLNGLDSGSHTAVLKLYRSGNLIKTYNAITFQVYAPPAASITY
jgi:hypothetical protein